jgi:hypothetical protein
MLRLRTKSRPAKQLPYPYSQLANIIGSMAYATGYILLAVKIEIIFTDLKRMSDGELVNRFSTILNAGAEYLRALTDYGVTGETLADDTELLNAYKAEIQKQALRVLDLKEVTKQLKYHFKIADNLLKPLDKMVKASRVSDPVWYSFYQSARTINIVLPAAYLPKAKYSMPIPTSPFPAPYFLFPKLIPMAKRLARVPTWLKMLKFHQPAEVSNLKTYPTEVTWLQLNVPVTKTASFNPTLEMESSPWLCCL